MTSRKGLRLTLDVTLHAVTCPGERLLFRCPIYLKACILNHQKKTSPTHPTFPLKINEQLHFEKSFPNCRYLNQLCQELEEEHVFFELVHCVDGFGCEVVLAEYETSLREFIFPGEKLRPFTGQGLRSILLNRTVHHLGIQPRLEFTTKVVIGETVTPVLDYLRDISKPDDPYCDLDLAKPPAPVCPDHGDASACPRHPYICRKPEGHTTLHPAWHSQSYQRSKGFKVPSRYRQAESSLDKVSDHLNLILSGKDSERKRPPFVVRKVPDAHDQAWTTDTSPSRNKVRPSGSDVMIDESVKASHQKLARAGSLDDVCLECMYPHVNKRCTICRLYRQYIGKQYWGHGHCRHYDKDKFSSRAPFKSREEFHQEDLARRLDAGLLVSRDDQWRGDKDVHYCSGHCGCESPVTGGQLHVCGQHCRCDVLGEIERRGEQTHGGASGSNRQKEGDDVDRRINRLYAELQKSYRKSRSPPKRRL